VPSPHTCTGERGEASRHLLRPRRSCTATCAELP